MTAATIAIGFLLALAIGLLLGHRMGVQDGIREMCRELDRVDSDHAVLKEFWAKWKDR